MDNELLRAKQLDDFCKALNFWNSMGNRAMVDLIYNRGAM